MATAQVTKIRVSGGEDIDVNLPQHASQIFKSLDSRLQYHIDLCQVHIQKYRKMARFARYALPTGAAIVSVLAAPSAFSKDVQGIGMAVFVLSAAVSILSTVNSVARPLQKYFHHVRYINKFWQLRTDMVVSIVEVSDSSTDSKQEKLLYQMLKQYSLAVDQLVQQFSSDSYSLMSPVESKQEERRRRRRSSDLPQNRPADTDQDIGRTAA